MNTTMTRILAGSIVVAATAATATSQTIVSPADRTALEGNVSTSYPLGRYDARIQQLHNDLGSSAQTFSGHAYRRDATSLHGAVAAFTVEMSVTLSMSPRTPGNASRTFSDNIGTPVLVVPRTWVSFPGTVRPSQAPASSFTLQMPYATPFSYPAGGGTVCVDTIVYANDGPNGQNRNFTAYQDGHQQYPDGRNVQPGYRYGQGCAPAGGGSPGTASFELRQLPTGMEFRIQARNGMPTDARGPGMSALVTGFQQRSQAFALRPACQQLVSPDVVFPLPGANTSQGHWNGLLQGFAALPIGMKFYVQIASGHLSGGLAMSDASAIVVPPPGPKPTTVTRIAHGSDRTSATGTVSSAVPVTAFN